MADKTWKAVERRIAVKAGTRRNPGSGRSGGTGRSDDAQHDRYYIEVKTHRTATAPGSAIVNVYTRAAKMAAQEGDKIPIVVIAPFRKRRQIALVDYDLVLAALDALWATEEAEAGIVRTAEAAEPDALMAWGARGGVVYEGPRHAFTQGYLAACQDGAVAEAKRIGQGIQEARG